jgi:acyl-CoA-binding protein
MLTHRLFRADRVFVHALSTVKKIPKTGASRPPSSDRLRLYGLYKQAMEGDVDGVMERPSGVSGIAGEDLQRERDKWDAWNSQKGLSRTDAKRRYIEALIDTMHRYANTPWVPSGLLLSLETMANERLACAETPKSSSQSSSLSGTRLNMSVRVRPHLPRKGRHCDGSNSPSAGRKVP